MVTINPINTLKPHVLNDYRNRKIFNLETVKFVCFCEFLFWSIDDFELVLTIIFAVSRIIAIAPLKTMLQKLKYYWHLVKLSLWSRAKHNKSMKSHVQKSLNDVLL